MSAHFPRLAADEPTGRVRAALEEHGAVIVEGVLDADLLRRFNAELDPMLDATSPKRPYLNPAIEFFFGDRVRQITGLAARSQIFGKEVLCHPFYRDVCDAILGPSCARYQLNVAQVMDRGPGAERLRTYDAPILEAPPAYRVCFCSRCGSCVPDPESDSDWFEIAAGLLEDDPQIQPDKHIFVELEAPWLAITDALPCFDKPALVRHRIAEMKRATTSNRRERR